MTSATEHPPTTAGSRPGAGRSGLVVAVLVLAFAVYLTVGLATMTVPASAEPPGPKFFPTLLAVGCYALAVLLTVHYLRHREPPSDTDGVEEVEQVEGTGGPGRRRASTFTDWRTVGLVLAGFLAFALLLNPLGWILSAALMFWVIAWAMGSGSPLKDVGIALVLSCAVQVAFSAGLGLHLPAGILGGVL
ncbi:tripartite tricarboxylate transporter TctB family protein [Kineococcus sp. SYSU DK002]|uniref:tripartite tricarboxylate transporter TctB family protein n=1 Tax=Kineococcus sp. SYSU DK002 TaxID=3383123 RepID=UPI003D7E7010